MYKKMELQAYKLLSRYSFANDNEKYLFLISYVACAFAATMHLSLLVIHLAIGILPLFIIDIFGFLVDVILFRLVKKGYYPLFGILLSISVILHVLVSTIHIGSGNLVIMYLLVTLVMQIIIPYANVRLRVLISVVLWACMIAVVCSYFNMTPVWDIGDTNIVLALFNLHLVVFGIVIQLTIGNIIWDAIMKFNRAELEKSRNEANTDPLTGLFNRRFAEVFFKKLGLGRIDQVWCVAMLDIDDFKVINDINGHQVGDDVLVSVSKIIKSSLRKTDIVIRWGGEEFLILLKDIDIDTSFRILDKLRGRIESEDMEINGKILKITVTIGVCPLDNNNVEQSIETCDRLMYKGKTSGKNIVMM